MHKFIVAIKLDYKEEDKFVQYLKKEGMGWWHRVDGFWMISTHKSDITVNTIRTVLTEISKNTSIVIKVENKGWSGFGLPDDFDWMKDNWN